MNKISGKIILGTLIATVIASYSMVPLIYAQSSGKTQTGCQGSTVGLVCVSHLGSHHLPTGRWHAEVNGVEALLVISSVDKAGNVQGTLSGGNFTCAIGRMPCEIHGTFNDITGRISFLATSPRCQPPVCAFASPVQNYTGFESEIIMPDNEHYQIYGIGQTIRPTTGEEFGWMAKMFCGFAGCIG